MRSINKFIQAVRDEKSGFTLDKPWRLEESSLMAVVPILRKTTKKRTYITFAEAEDITIEDTGQIAYVYVKNNDKKPVFISRGSIFRGKTQERAAIHGHIIMPKKGLRVAVRCIHASKGIITGTDMGYGGSVSYQIDLSDQNKTWQSITAYNTVLYTNTNGNVGIGDANPQALLHGEGLDDFVTTNTRVYTQGTVTVAFNGMDNYVGGLDDFSDAMKDVLRKIPYIKNQTGAIFFNDNNIMGLDVYDVPDSWDSVKKEMIEKEGASFVDKDNENLFEFKPEAAKKVINKKLKDDFEEKSIYDKEYKIIGIKGNNLLGEATIFNNSVIHLTLWKNNTIN